MRKALGWIAAGALIVALAIVPEFLTATVAYAQTAVVAVADPQPGWLTDIETAMYALAGTAVAAAITWASTYVTAHYHVSIEQKWRDALHSAIMSGILLGLKRIGYSGMPDSAVITPDMQAKVIGTAVSYAKQSVPAAITGLKATDAGVDQLATAKLEGVLSGLILPAAGGAPTPAPASSS